MPPTRPFPDPAPLTPEEEEDDAETVQMAGPELQALLASVRHSDAGSTPAPISRTPTLPTRNSSPGAPPVEPQPEPVARWPWLLAALAMAMLVALAVATLF